MTPEAGIGTSAVLADLQLAKLSCSLSCICAAAALASCSSRDTPGVKLGGRGWSADACVLSCLMGALVNPVLLLRMQTGEQNI